MDYIINQEKSHTMLPQVLKAAVKLFVQQGVDATTIKDIAQEAGVSVGALYNHFKGKEDLAWYLFSTHLHAFTQTLKTAIDSKPTYDQKILAFVETSFSAFEDNRDLFVYLINSENREFQKYPRDLDHPGTVAIGIIQAGQNEGILKSGDPSVLSSLITGTVIRLAMMRMYNDSKEDLRQNSQIIAESLWKALKI